MTTFHAGDTVFYTGEMLPQLRNRELAVTLAHAKSGFGDPATDDVCLVIPATGGVEYRVNSTNLYFVRGIPAILEMEA